MNAPLQALYTTGATLYAVLINPDTGDVWNEEDQVWEEYDSGHWSQYAVELGEYAGSGYYRADYPIETPLVLSSDLIFVQGGGSPALGDIPAAPISQSQGSNVAAIGQIVGSSNKLALTTNGMLTGTVVAGTLTPSSFSTDLSSTTNAAYQGRVCLFTSGDLINQVGNIISYDGTTFILTVGGPFTSAPSVDDTFIII